MMKRTLALILAALCANAPAVELALTQPELAKCEREGGCTVITQRMLEKLLMQARRSGMATCESEI